MGKLMVMVKKTPRSKAKNEDIRVRAEEVLARVESSRASQLV